MLRCMSGSLRASGSRRSFAKSVGEHDPLSVAMQALEEKVHEHAARTKVDAHQQRSRGAESREGVPSGREGVITDVELDRSGGAPLGIDILTATLTILKISDGGLMADWNAANPEKRIKLGDEIVEVNGKRGGVQIIGPELRRNELLILRVRARENTDEAAQAADEAAETAAERKRCGQLELQIAQLQRENDQLARENVELHVPNNKEFGPHEDEVETDAGSLSDASWFDSDASADDDELKDLPQDLMGSGSAGAAGPLRFYIATPRVERFYIATPRVESFQIATPRA